MTNEKFLGKKEPYLAAPQKLTKNTQLNKIALNYIIMHLVCIWAKFQGLFVMGAFLMCTKICCTLTKQLVHCAIFENNICYMYCMLEFLF